MLVYLVIEEDNVYGEKNIISGHHNVEGAVDMINSITDGKNIYQEYGDGANYVRIIREAPDEAYEEEWRIQWDSKYYIIKQDVI